MTAQSKPAKTHDTTSDLVQTAHAEFLASLEQAIEASRQVQHAPPLVPSEPEHPAPGPTQLPPQRGPRAAVPGTAPAEPRRDHDARRPDPFGGPPMDQRLHGGSSTSLPQQVQVPIDRSPRSRVPGEQRALDRISGGAHLVSSEQQRQREAVIERLRQRRVEPSDRSQWPKPQAWLGIAPVTRLAIVGVIALVVGFAVYELVGSQWHRLFASAGEPAQGNPDRPSLLTDLSDAAAAKPPEPAMPKPVKTATITADAGSSIVWPDPPMPSNVAAAANAEPAVNAEPAANAMRTASAEPAASIGPTGESAAVVASRQLDSEELAKLLKRSETFLNNGDIAAARLLLRRAAEAGDARAAVALAATYDPLVLKQLGTVGAKDDIAQARAWYQRASQLGSAEAGTRLQQLAQEVR